MKKKLTEENYKDLLQKNKSLIKATDDPTVVYVFSGHPHDSYMGREDDSILLLYSLSTNEYRKVRDHQLEGGKTRPTYYVVSSEEDVLSDLGDNEKGTYQKFLDRVEKVFR